MNFDRLMDDAGGSADFRSSACVPFLNAFAAKFIFLIFLFDQLSSITARSQTITIFQAILIHPSNAAMLFYSIINV